MQRLAWLVRCISVMSLALLAAPASAQDDVQCFPETEQCIGGRFREFWQQYGGLAVFGFPVSGAADELNIDLNRPVLTQWFERERLELHPDNSRPYDVLLGRLGADQLRARGTRWESEPRGQPRAGCLWFPVTQHTVCDQQPGIGFKSYWQNHGLEFDGRAGTSYEESLALFGLPLTEPRMETNSSGDTVLTQWFERARFEWHPQNRDQFKVLLGLLGNEARRMLVVKINPGLPGRMIVQSQQLYELAADGSRISRLPYALASGGIAVSPDGSKVALRCSRNGGVGLCVSNLNGSQLARINDDPSVTVGAWSPDSTHIAYVSGLDGRRGLHVVLSDGSGDRLVASATPSRMVASPSWSPDGTRLVFNTVFGETALYVVGVDGEGMLKIAQEGANGRWSPGGNNAIVFESTIGGTSDIWSVAPDGTALRQLTNTPEADEFPAWSPFGTQIAFRRGIAGEPSPAGTASAVMVMAADGSQPVEALRSAPPYSITGFGWSHDGAYVAASRFCSRLCGPGQILAVRPDGSGRVVVAEGARAGEAAALIVWLPPR